MARKSITPRNGRKVEITWKNASGTHTEEIVELLTRGLLDPGVYVTKSGARVRTIDVLAGGF